MLAACYFARGPTADVKPACLMPCGHFSSYRQLLPTSETDTLTAALVPTQVWDHNSVSNHSSSVRRHAAVIWARLFPRVLCQSAHLPLPTPARRLSLVHIISFVRARDSHWPSVTSRGIRIRWARTCREPRRGATESINSECWGSQPPDRQRRGPIRGPLLGVAVVTQLRGEYGNECLSRVIGLSGRVSGKVLTCFHYL